MDCSLPGSSVHGIIQARILEWVAVPFSRGCSLLQGIFPTPEIEPRSPALPADSLPSESKKKSIENTGESPPKTCFIDYTKAFDCVDHNKLWKILKEMGIPDHLTFLLRNLYAGQEATVRIRLGTVGLVPNWERSTSRLYIVTLLI